MQLRLWRTIQRVAPRIVMLQLATSVACSSDGASPQGESTDGADSSGASPTTSEADPTGGPDDSTTGPAVCGDGQIQEGEGCDDGNDDDGDGCSADCRPAGEQLWRTEVDAPEAPPDAAYRVSLAGEEIVTSLAWTSDDVHLHRLGRHDADGELLWGLEHPEQAEVAGDEMVDLVGLVDGRMLGAFTAEDADAGFVRVLGPDGRIAGSIGALIEQEEVTSVHGGTEQFYFTSRHELTGITIRAFDLRGGAAWLHQETHAYELPLIIPFGAGFVAFAREGTGGTSVTVLDVGGAPILERDFEVVFGLAAVGENVFVHNLGQLTRIGLAGDAVAVDVPTTFTAIASAANGDLLTVADAEDSEGDSVLSRYSPDLVLIWDAAIAGSAHQVMERQGGTLLVAGSSAGDDARWWFSAHRP